MAQPFLPQQGPPTPLPIARYNSSASSASNRSSTKLYRLSKPGINPGLPSVLKLVVILLLVIMGSTVLTSYVSGVAINNQKFTFYGFISMLQEVPTISFAWVSNLNVVLDFQFPDWLSWLNVLWKPIQSMLTVSAFVANSLLNVAAFIYYLLTYFIMP